MSAAPSAAAEAPLGYTQLEDRVAATTGSRDAAAGVSAQTVAKPAAEIEARQAEKQAELDNVSREITLSGSRLEALADEIAGIKKDHASITAALIQAAKTERKLALVR